MNRSKFHEIYYAVDVVSKLLGVEFQLIDREANPLLSSHPHPDLASLFHNLFIEQHQVFKERILRLIHHSSGSPSIFFYEIFAGLKVAVTPVTLAEPCFLIFGFYCSTIPDAQKLRARLESELNQPLKDMDISNLPYLDENGIQYALHELGRLQSHIADVSRYIRAEGIMQTQNQLKDQLCDIFMEAAPLEAKFRKAAKLIQQYSALSVMGLALPVNKKRFSVKYVYGKENETWLDHQFDTGEGFFGWAALMQKPVSWQDITQDPMYYSIRDVNDLVQSLEVFPLIHNNKVIGVLFAASEGKGAFDEPFLSFVKSVLTHFVNEIILLDYESRVEYLSKKTTILMGISQLLSANKDPVKVLNIVVDFLMSIEGVEQSFGVILNKTLDTIENLVGRGVTVEEIKRHCSALVAGNMEEYDREHLTFFPIVTNQITRGWFYIASKSKIRPKELLFTNTLVSVAALVLKGIDHSEHESDESLIESLISLIRLKHPDVYNHSKRVKQIVETLCNQMGIDERTRKIAVQGSLLHEIGVLVMEFPEQRMEKLHSGNVNEQPHYGAQVLESFRPFRNRIASVVRLHHVSFEDMVNHHQPEEVSLAAQLLHISDDFDAFTHRFTDNSEKVISILKEMERNKGTKYHPELFEALMHVMNRRYTIEVADVQLGLPKKTSQTTFDVLSQREKEVLGLIVEGLSNKEIANRLIISEHTVKNHVSNIFAKMNVSDRTSLVSLAYQKGYST